jgi:hypothetical protein
MSNHIKWATTDAPFVRNKPALVSFEPNPDANGYVDWMELLSPSHDVYQMWCKKVGTWLAGYHLGKDTSEFTWKPLINPTDFLSLVYDTYVMDGFPEGYTLYHHHKTAHGLSAPRCDTYLYGMFCHCPS